MMAVFLGVSPNNFGQSLTGDFFQERVRLEFDGWNPDIVDNV
jgi:hypothetical protein